MPFFRKRWVSPVMNEAKALAGANYIEVNAGSFVREESKRLTLTVVGKDEFCTEYLTAFREGRLR